MNLASVGVDLGGSWIRVQGLDAQGRRVRSLKKPAPKDGTLPRFLRNLLKSWGGRPQALVIASKGIWTPTECKAFAKSLKGLARHVQTMSDVEAAWLAAFANNVKPAGPSILVVAGTGSIAVARDAQGRALRSGGMGPLLGDEGSAFWIGRQWLRENPKGLSLSKILGHLRFPASPVRTIAALAPEVIRRARQRDREALAILRVAQNHLAALVEDLAEQLQARRELSVSWGGSLLDNPWFRQGFLAALRHRLKGKRIHVVRPATDAATAAARSGLSYFHG